MSKIRSFSEFIGWREFGSLTAVALIFEASHELTFNLIFMGRASDNLFKRYHTSV